MRILIHSAPPWAPSGYGIQAGLAARALAGLGHDVALSIYAGVFEEKPWEGIPVLGCGGKPYGNGLIAFNYRRWHADLLITLTDVWILEPGQFAGLAVMPWIPLDTDPIGAMDASWLHTVRQEAASLHPVAMAAFGASMLASAGWGDVPVVPHAVPGGFAAAAGGPAWRKQMGLAPDAFVIAKVGVSNEDDRKAFGPTLEAFARFAARHDRARLYLHTEAQAPKAPNLAYMAKKLGLQGKVAFAGQDERAADLYPASWMASMYAAADVLDAATRSEGFGVPIVEALACGTPVIGCRNSAVPEKIRPAWGWLVNGQREWTTHHQSWWSVPLVHELERAYDKAAAGAGRMRAAAAAEGRRWTVAAMSDAWAKVLAGL